MLVFAAGVNRDDVGMSERGGGPSFLKEPVEGFLLVNLTADDLDGNLTVELHVPAEVNGSHSAGTDLADDLEAADPGGESH